MSFRRDAWDVNPDERADATCERLALDAEMRFLDGLLGAGTWAVSGERVHVDSYSPEFTPIIDGCDALGRNVTVATGTHGSGIRLAPGIADAVANKLSAMRRTVAWIYSSSVTSVAKVSCWLNDFCGSRTGTSGRSSIPWANCRMPLA